MTDDTAARMRALESEERLLRERVKWHTAVDFPTMSVRTDVLLALLDALDEARRERDEARNEVFAWSQAALKAGGEKNAAMAVLREARDELRGMHDRISFRTDPPNEVVARLDALLGGGEGV